MGNSGEKWLILGKSWKKLGEMGKSGKSGEK